jgi:membrane-associated phospholipid phosphatase
LYVGAHHVSDVLTELVVVTFWIWTCARLLLPARTAASDRAGTRAEAATPA